MRWCSAAVLILVLTGACGSGGGGGTAVVVIDVSAAITADMFDRSAIPPHGAQVVIQYAAVSPPGLPDPLPPIHRIEIPFGDQIPAWTVVLATAVPANWTETFGVSSYSVSTTTDPLTAGNQLTLIFSYNTVTLQEATQFQTGPIHLFGAGGESLGTAGMLYR